MSNEAPREEIVPVVTPRTLVALVCAWLVPGLGHAVLGRLGRALLLAVPIFVLFGFGVALHGPLYTTLHGSPLAILATLGSMGTGAPYFFLRLSDFQPLITGPGYEYGKAFMIGAGVMNLLLVLDAWDIGRGVKE